MNLCKTIATRAAAKAPQLTREGKNRGAARLLSSGLLAALMAACGTVVVEHAPMGPNAPVHNGDVRIVMEGGEQPHGMREIAIIQVQATGVKASLPTAMEAMKTRARELGCDTVAKVSVDRGGSMVLTGVCGLVGSP